MSVEGITSRNTLGGDHDYIQQMIDRAVEFGEQEKRRLAALAAQRAAELDQDDKESKSDGASGSHGVSGVNKVTAPLLAAGVVFGGSLPFANAHADTDKSLDMGGVSYSARGNVVAGSQERTSAKSDERNSLTSKARVDTPQKTEKPSKRPSFIDNLKESILGGSDDVKGPSLPSSFVPKETPTDLFYHTKKPENALDDIRPDSNLPDGSGGTLSVVGDTTHKQKQIEDLAGLVGIGNRSKSSIEKDEGMFNLKLSPTDLTKEDGIVPLVTPPRPKPAPRPEIVAEPAPNSESAPESEPTPDQTKTGERPPRVSAETERIINGMSYLNSEKKEFFKNILLDVTSARNRYPDLKVNSEIMIAQAIMESGWGGSSLTREYNAYFGIKTGTKWKGKVAPGQYTAEYTNSGQRYYINDNFRAYDSREESVVDYIKFINGLSRYSEAVKNADSPEGYANGLKKGGYATSPSYAKDLVNLADQQKLKQLLELEEKNYREYNRQQTGGKSENSDPVPEVSPQSPPAPDPAPAPELAPEKETGISTEARRKYSAYLGAVGLDPDLLGSSKDNDVDEGKSKRRKSKTKTEAREEAGSSVTGAQRNFIGILNEEAAKPQEATEEDKFTEDTAQSEQSAPEGKPEPAPEEPKVEPAPASEKPQNNPGSDDVPFDPNTFVSPVPKGANHVVMTANYGKYPSGGKHWGVDLGGRKGVGWDVLSVCTGTVEEVRINKKYANKNAYNVIGSTNYVWIRCDSGEYVGYAHMNEKDIRAYIKPGSRIVAGTVIGPEGNQGNSKGPHLHLQVNGKSIDGKWYSAAATENPVKFLAEKGVKLPKMG